MKIRVSADTDFADIEKYFEPARCFGQEKLTCGAYDDWDEAVHSENWLRISLSALRRGEGGELYIYTLEEEGRIIGSAFVLCKSPQTLQSLKKDGVVPESGQYAHFTCFHVLKEYRGQGRGRAWLEEILSDLRTQGIEEVYIRSSHHRALPLYEKLGEKVGNYISVSDHQLYQRYGYIYKITL